MLKKILGAFLAITLLLPVAGVVHANSLSEPLYGFSPVLSNGSFSAGEAGWEVSGGSIKNEDGNAIYVPAEQGAKATQLITGLTPNVVYECTFRMKSSNANAAYIGIVQKNYEEGTDVRAATSGAPWERIVNYSFTYGATFENWTDFRFTFAVPTGGNAVSLSFGANRGDDILAFDDICVVRAQNLINNSSLDEAVPTCINNGIGTTELPFQWTGWRDGCVIEGTGVDGTKGLSILAGPTYLTQSICIPLQGGGDREYVVSYRYMVKRRNADTSESVVEQYLKTSYAFSRLEQVGTSTAITAGSYEATEEGVWYKGSRTVKVSNTEPVAFNLLFRRSGGGTTDDLLICFDDIRVEYAKGSTTWHIHGNTEELIEFPTSSDLPLRARRMQYNHGTTDMNVRLIVCIYKEVNGVKCLDKFAMSDSITITPGNRVLGTEFYKAIDLPTMEEGATYYAEAFVWDSLQGLTALAEKSVLR